jgi:hypothetical protein
MVCRLDARDWRRGQREFIWRPELSPRGPVVVLVSLPDQIVRVFRNGLAIIVWLAILFASYSMFAKPSAVVAVALVIVALSVSSALFLTANLNHPFAGFNSPANRLSARLRRWFHERKSIRSGRYSTGRRF